MNLLMSIKIAQNKISFAVVVLLLTLAFAVYANSFRNQFVLDDLELVVNNPLIESRQNIIDIFKVGLFPAVPLAENFYRPVQSLTLKFDYLLWRKNPFGYHITNTLIHTINAILIFSIVLLITHNRRIAMIASVLFAVHPIHTAAVTYISGRADPLVALFGLTSLSFFIIYSEFKRILYYLASVVFFILALLSKEISLVLPLLFILYDICFLKKEKKTNVINFWIKRYAIYIFIVIAYILLRASVFNFSSFLQIGKLDFTARFLTACYIFLNYLKLLILPFGLHIDRTIQPIVSIFSPYCFAKVVILAVLGYAFIKSYKISKIIFFASAWFLINFIPISNLFRPLNAPMAEHWMYFPSIGFFILAAVGIDKIASIKLLKHSESIIVIFLIVSLSILTIKQNFVWKDRHTLYRHALKFSPNRPRLHSYLGNAYKDQGLFELALSEFNEAIRLNPEYAENYCNLGNLYEKTGRYNDAINAYRKSIAIKPKSASAYNNLGNVFTRKGEDGKAIEAYKKAAELSVNDYEIWVNLANIYLRTQNFKDSTECYKKAIELTSGSAEVYYNLGIAYAQINDFSAAKECWQKAVAIDPDFQKAKSNLEKLNRM